MPRTRSKNRPRPTPAMYLGQRSALASPGYAPDPAPHPHRSSSAQPAAPPTSVPTRRRHSPHSSHRSRRLRRRRRRFRFRRHKALLARTGMRVASMLRVHLNWATLPAPLAARVAVRTGNTGRFREALAHSAAAGGRVTDRERDVEELLCLACRCQNMSAVEALLALPSGVASRV